MSKQLNYTSPVLNGKIKVPGDKSISHRAVMFGAMAQGKTEVTGFLAGEDCLRTIDCFRQLGVQIIQDGERVTVESDGMNAWKEPAEVLYTGNSGTTTRLMLGILAGTSFHSIMTGDASIGKRPMNRVLNPLREMGADIRGREGGQYTPVAVQGKALKAFEYTMPIASAQVKSAILLAALNAEGTTTIIEPVPSRNHTEIMLQSFGVQLSQEDGKIEIPGNQQLTAANVEVPGDISSAAFMIGAALLAEGSDITIEQMGTNPTRTGILDVIEAMGADYELVERDGAGEPSADMTIRYSKLAGTEIGGALIPRLIDEIPLLALVATQAEGTTVIKDAEELRVKETDRIDAVVTELKKLGADIEATADGMVINGPTKLTGAKLASYGDHRLGMMAAVASLITDGPVEIDDAECIAVSYPNFFEQLESMIR